MRPAGGPREDARSGHARRAAMTALLLLALALFVAFVGLALASGPDSALSAWDRRVTAAFIDWRTPGRSHLFWAITLIGNDPVLVALGFSAVMLLTVWGMRARAVLVAVGMLVGWGISSGAKAIVGRPRPPAVDALIELPSSYSMPSGHALSTLVLFGLLTYLAWRLGGGAAGRGGPAAGGAGTRGAWLVTVICVALAALVGISRVYLGVHWLSDAFGGWFLGGAWLAVFLGVIRPLLVRSGRAGVSAVAPPGQGGRSAAMWGAAAAFFARRPPVPVAWRVAACLFALVLCVVVFVLAGIADPLLADL